MAIKRVTIEIDDSLDMSAPTGSLDQPTETKITEAKGKHSTRLPDYAPTEKTEPLLDSPLPQATVGRTFPDLIAESQENPRVMATILTFVPFVVFITRLNNFQAFKYPILLAVILNLVWFGFPLLLVPFRWVAGLFHR